LCPQPTSVNQNFEAVSWNCIGYYKAEGSYHSLDNVSLPDVFYGRGKKILKQRKMIKQSTLAMRLERYNDRKMKPLINLMN
jgi:hypothetical protein